MTTEKFEVNRPQYWHIPNGLSTRKRDRLKTRCLIKGRGFPALRKECNADKGGKARHQDVNRHARNDLIALMGDAGKAMQQGQADRCDNRSKQPNPWATGVIGHRSSRKGPAQHHAFKGQVDRPGSLGKHACKGGKDQGCRCAKCRIKKQNDQFEIFHHAASIRSRRKRHAV